jgi:SAM-dependent methyltransferase
MRREDYLMMAQLEDDHWWYRGLRDLLTRLIRPYSSSFGAAPRIFDLGCGTGANLRMLARSYPTSQLYGLDISSFAVKLASRKCPVAEIYPGDLRNPLLPADSFHCVISCDALYVPGLRASFSGLQKVIERIEVGGIFVLHLPAYQWLYSQHDQAMGTSERYTIAQVASLLVTLGLRPEWLSYHVSLMFPLIVAKRSSQWLRWDKRVEPKSDLAMPVSFVNRVLFRILQIENVAITRRLKMPFGCSVIAVGRKV